MVSPTVVYLALDEASYINGQQLSVAGGNIALFPSRPKPVSILIKKDTWSLDDLVELMPETLEVNMDNPA